MKKIVSMCVILALILATAVPAYCNGPIRKLGRGVANMLTCPLEVPHNLLGANARVGVNEVVYGLAEGFSKMVIRAAVGLVEVVTFPLPLPQPAYEPILKDPEFMLAR